MDGFGLLCGHLLEDYILQNDFIATNKVIWGRDIENGWDCDSVIDEDGNRWTKGTTPYHNAWVDDVFKQRAVTRRGHYACTLHCLLYTLAVWACSFSWMPWWGLLVCFLVHWPIDRFRLVRLWMERVSGQKAFATGPLAPWSIIVVDNTFHLLTLYAIALFAGRG